MQKVLRFIPICCIFLVMIWLANLASTDAYFSIYVLFAFFSFFLYIRRKAFSSETYHNVPLCIVLSIVFSSFVLLANYPVFTTIGDPAVIGRSTSIAVNLINSILSFFGGICVAYPIIGFVFNFFPLSGKRILLKGKWLPFFLFLFIFSIHFFHLIFVEYPGNLTEDSFTQISEMISGKYSNFNTFWHTMLFRFVLTFSYQIFSDINFAVFTFTVFQLVVLVFSFTYCLMTMIAYGVPRWVVCISFAVFAFMPYHMALTITIWKDVLFAAGCLLILSAWLRIHCNISQRTWSDYLVFLLGSLLFIVSRTNGWLIFLLSALVYFAFFHKNKPFLATLGAISLVGWFLLNPALSLLNVESGDLVESLSIPIQQVSRVIADGEELTEEEESLLSLVVDLDEVPQLYINWISDPMKVEVRSKDYDYFKEHFDEFVSLWVDLGLRYPSHYLKAWVDQTKGYWNAGYDYAMYSETITENPYGVEKSGGLNPIAALFRLYFGLSRHVIFFEPLHSIGLHVWVFLLCFILNIRKHRDIWFLFIPILILLTGLWFGTPVYSCFRYVYPLFISFPLILSVSIWNRSETLEHAIE